MPTHVGWIQTARRPGARAGKPTVGIMRRH